MFKGLCMGKATRIMVPRILPLRGVDADPVQAVLKLKRVRFAWVPLLASSTPKPKTLNPKP